MPVIKAVISVIVFLSLFIMLLLSVALISLGILAVPLSLMVMTGLFTSVASELPPPSALFAGIACLCGGAALCLAVIVLFPKQAVMFKRNAKR